MADVRTALDGENPEDIREKISALQKATMKIGEAMQGSSQQAAPESEQQSSEQSTEGEKKE